MKVHSPKSAQSNGSPRGMYQVPKEKLTRAITLKIWLGAVIFLFLAGTVMLIVGIVFWQTGLAIFLSGFFCLVLAVPMLALYVWYLRWQKVGMAEKSSKGQNKISTIGNPELYTPAPLQLKSDYPMGPLLIMTLPRTKSYSPAHRVNDIEEESSPDISEKTYPLKLRNKNLPPLASVETLSPSVTSSVVSLDTAI